MPRRRIGLIVGVLVLGGLSVLFEDRFFGVDERDDARPGADAGPFAAPEPGHQERRRAARDARASAARRRADVPTTTVPSITPPRASGEDAPGSRFGRLEGDVRGRGTDAPVPGAELTFTRDGASVSVRSDERGHFVLEASAPGVHTLAVVDAEGFTPWSPSWGHSPVRYTARPGRVVRGLRIRLAPASRLTVEVVDGEGAPVPGAELRVLGPAGRPLPVGDPSRTGASGESRLPAPEGSLVEARVERAGTTLRGRARVDLRATLARRLRIVLGGPTESAVLAGEVRDLEGAPISGALVRATPANEGDSLRPEHQALTGPEGRFRLATVDRTTYDVEARATGFAREAQRIDAPNEALALVLGAEAGLRGQVEGPDGEPAAAFALLVSAVLGPVERSLRGALEVYTDDGRFEVGGLASGVYELRAVVEGAAPSAPLRVNLPPAQWRDVGVLRVAAGGGLRGVVRGGTDGQERLEGAWVTLEGAAGEAPLALRREARSDASGHFRLEGLALGPRSLTVTAPGHHVRIVSAVVIAEGEPTEVEVQLDALATEEEEARLQLVGIGAVLSASGEGLEIGRVLEGAGAARAGLGAGDTILAIDGQAVTELGFEGSIERIRGAENSAVMLRVRRGDAERDVRVIRVRVET